MKKGEIIELIDADLLSINFSSSLLKNKSKLDNAFFGTGFCGMCGSAIAVANESDSITRLPQCDISTNDLPPGCWSSFQYYCSSTCEKRYQNLYALDGEFHATRQFFDRIKKNIKDPDIDDLALFIAAKFYTKLMAGVGDVDEKYKKMHKACQKTNDLEIDERVMECWVILRSDVDISERKMDEEELMTAAAFNAMYHFIRQKCLHQISIPHPLIYYIEEKLLKLSDDELKSALKLLNSNLPRTQSKDNDSLQVSEKVLRWRNAVRLVQAINGNMLDDEVLSSMYDKKAIKSMGNLKRSCFIFCPDTHLLQHSCVPNCIVQGVTSDAGTGAVKVGLVALQDIKKGHDLTLSTIDDLTANVEERQTQLRRIYGSSNCVCECVRCRCETRWGDKDNFNMCDNSSMSETQKDHFHCEDLKSIGDLAMQHSRYKTAGDLYRLVLKMQPKNGDVLHALCASLLERGCFEKAQEMWKEAYKLCPRHNSISLQIKKQNAYYQYDGTKLGAGVHKFQVKEGLYATLIPSKAFVTKEDSPIISHDECSRAITWAEATAKVRPGGWTTSRHYAVPTTDMPLHDIPPLLDWFNGVLENRLRPLLAMQFGEEEVGNNGSDVFIHDAFIVRYDASGGQKHLPLHRDQSTHSFTIALNSMSEYDGGGTFIDSLKKAVLVSKGGALSFRGDQLLHGGDPVVGGRRYIIVAFCYVCKPSTIGLEGPTSKKMKIDGLFGRTDRGKSKNRADGDFSFGFQF